MPQSVIVAYQGPVGLRYIEAAFAQWSGGSLAAFESQLQVTIGERSPIVIAGLVNRSIAVADYEDNEDNDTDLRELAGSLNYIYMTFSDLVVAREVLERLLRFLVAGGRCWVDSDHGWVRTGEWFLAQLSRSPDWTWRTASPSDG